MIFFEAVGMFVVGLAGVLLLGILLAYIWCLVPIARVKKIKRLEQKNKKLRDNLRNLGIKYKELKEVKNRK